MTRASARKMLHLSHVPVPFFHKKPWEWGLGIMEMETGIMEQLNKLKEKLYNQDRIWIPIVESIKVPHSVKLRRIEMRDFVDGRGLMEARKKPGCYG